MATLKVAIDAREARSGSEEFAAATKRMKQGAKEATDATGEMQGKVDSLGAAGGKLKLAFAAAGASLTAAFALNSAKNAIGAYEQTLANLRGVTGATTAEMQQFDETANALGSRSQFAPDEIAGGLLNLAKAGFTANQAMGAIRGSLDLATAGEVSLSEATETVASTLAQFRLGIGDSTRVANTLVIAANATQASVQGVAEAMKYSGPLAAALGVSMEDTAAAIGVLSNAGIQGSLAGTNLRGIMASLINPSSEASRIFETLGVNLSDVNVKTQGVVGALTNLQKAGAGPAQLEAIFGKLNVSAAIALGTMSKDFTELQAKIKDGTGAAAELSGIMGDTLQGSLKQLSSTIQAVWIKLGKSGLAGSMRFAVDFTIDLIRALAGIDAPTKSVASAVEHVANAIRGAAIGLGAFLALNAAQRMIEFSFSLLNVGNAFSRLNLLMAKNPLGLIAVGIALAAVAFLEFKDEAIKVGDEVTTFGDIAAVTWDYIKETGLSSWNGLTDGLAKVWTWITSTFSTVVNAISVAWGLLGTSMDGTWSSLFSSILSVFKGFANILIGNFVAVARLVGNTFDTVVRAAKAIASFDFSKPGQSIESLADALSPKRIFLAAKEEVKKAYAEDYVGELVSSVKSAYQAAAPAFAAAGDIALLALDTVNKEITRRAVQRTKTRTDAADAERLRKLKEDADRAAEAMKGLGRAAADSGEGLGNAGDNADEASKKIKQLREEIDKEIASLEREASFRSLGVEAFSREVAIAEFRDRATKAQVKNIDELVSHYSELYDTNKLAASQREERERAKETLDDMRNELDLIRLTNAEREREAGLHAILKNAKHLDAEETKRLTAEYNDLIRQLQEAKAIREVADNLANSFGDAFESIVLGTKSLGQAFKDLFNEIEKELLRAIVIKPIVASVSGGLSSLFSGSGFGSLLSSAHGNVFDSGHHVTRYAKGGVTNGPEFFPLAGGRTGLRGEAGTEGVFPLKRLANGDLGIKGDSGGGGSTVINFNIRTNDADSFRKSRRQIASDIRRATGGSGS